MAAFRIVSPLQTIVKIHRSISLAEALKTGFVHKVRPNKPPCMYTNSFKRFQSSATTEEGSNETEPEKNKSWFVRWLHGEVPEPKPAKTEEELNERRILLEKVQEMYFSNPPKPPGVDFYVEAFHLLMKYNDSPLRRTILEYRFLNTPAQGKYSRFDIFDDLRIGVENLYEVMKEDKIEPGDKIIQEIESYIAKAREEAWYK